MSDNSVDESPVQFVELVSCDMVGGSRSPLFINPRYVSSVTLHCDLHSKEPMSWVMKSCGRGFTVIGSPSDVASWLAVSGQ